MDPLLFAAAIAALIVVALVATGVILLRRCHRKIVLAAAEPITVDKERVDAAEVLWSFRQVNESPHLSAITGSEVRSTAALATRIEQTMSNLPPHHAAQVVEAQIRLQRTDQLRALLTDAPRVEQAVPPMLADIAIVSLSEVVPGDTISAVAKAVLAYKLEAASGIVMDLPGVDTVAHTFIASASDHSVNLLGGAIDAHLPLVTIATSLWSAKKSFDAGLSGSRVGENAAWDIGARGGAMFAGAQLGTALIPVPVVGTVAGALAGGIGGALVSNYGKRRHLRRALRGFRESCKVLGAEISIDQLTQILDESARTIEDKTERLQHLDAELDRLRSSRSRVSRLFRPLLGEEVARRALEVGRADVELDWQRHQALTQALSTQALGDSERGFAWTAASTLLEWAELKGPPTNVSTEGLSRVRNEGRNLGLATR